MLLDYFKHKKLLDIASVEETFDSLLVKLCPLESMGSFVPKLFDELKTISPRDKFELFFDVAGNHIKISDCSSLNLGKIEQHINEYKEEETYEIELQIRKKLADHTLSVYFLDEFSIFLDHSVPLNLINSISAIFDTYLTFEVFSSTESFGSNTIRFTEVSSSQCNITNVESIFREEKLDLLFENSSVTNISLKLIPSDFFLLNQSDYTKINSFFEKQCSILSLLFISNSSELKNDGTLSYRITGYKTLASDDIDLLDLASKIKYLYKIYSWSFEGGNCADKIGLARNLLSIHLDEQGQIRFDAEAWEAIQSNYQIYLTRNIQSYLEVKNKIGEIVIESTAKTYLMVDELLDSLKNNIFVFLTFILTVVVVNGLKDNGEVSIFSNAYLAIVIILSLVSSLWLWMTNREIVNRFDSATETVKQILSLNYNKLLMESEINECVDPVIKKNKKYLHIQLKRYSKWWAILLAVFVLSFVAANRYFQPKEVHTDATIAQNDNNVKDKKYEKAVASKKDSSCEQQK